MNDITFKFLFDNSSDAVFVCDTHGKIQELNQAAVKMLGYEKEKLIGKSLRQYKSLPFKLLADKNLEKILTSGELTNESELIASEGKTISVEMKSSLLQPIDNQYILTVARCITERKAVEKKLLETIIRTEDKERKRFATDLHDNLNPILSTIKLYSDLLLNGNATAEKQKKLLEDIDNLADMAISTAKDIAVNITPSVLQDFGLAQALNEFCTYIVFVRKLITC